MKKRPTPAQQKKLVDAWNEKHPVGTPVTIWPGLREGPGTPTETTSAAELMGGHTAVVWTAARPAMALSHVEAVGR